MLLGYLALSSVWSETDEPEKTGSMVVRALSTWLFLIRFVAPLAILLVMINTLI